MTLQNSFKMELLSKSNNESFVRVAVAAFAAQLDPTIEEINDIKTAVSEAVTNCILHGYKNTLGKIYIKIELLEQRMLRIKIRDRGCGIANVQQAMEPLFTTGGEERSGLGFSFMHSFIDKVSVRSVPGRGTTVTLQKRLSVKL